MNVVLLSIAERLKGVMGIATRTCASRVPSFLIAMLCAAGAAIAAESRAFSHPGSFYVADQFSPGAKSDALKSILDLAGTLRNETPSPAKTFHVPGYFEVSDEQQQRVKEFQQQVRAAYVNALAHRVSGASKYIAPAKSIVLAWANTNREISGRDGPLVMNYLGVGLLVAADLIWDSFEPAEIEALQRWTREVFLRKAVAPELREHQNNHQSWAIFAGLMAAFVLEDRDLFASYARLLDLHIAGSIAYDGTLPHELARGPRAGWYIYFALAPILAGAQVVQNVTGEQLWDRHDRRIEKSLDRLYRDFSNPDRLGAGSGVNPENLFEAARGAYRNPSWADEDYLNKVRPIDASNDQHVAWEFPTAFPARRKGASATKR